MMGGGLLHKPSGHSPSRRDLKADRGAARRRQMKEHCLPPRGNVRELTFPFKELYKLKVVPTKRQHTPYHDTTELIALNSMQDQQIQAVYEGIKTRMKQLYRKEPVVFIQVLPATPAELVRQYRDFALTFFSREQPPVSCPLNSVMVEAVRSRISMRGSKAAKTVTMAMTGVPCT